MILIGQNRRQRFKVLSPFVFVCWHFFFFFNWGQFCLQREQKLNSALYFSYKHELLPFSLHLQSSSLQHTQQSLTALPLEHDGQACICNESGLRQLSCLHLRKLSSPVCPLMLSSDLLEAHCHPSSHQHLSLIVL